MVVSALVLAIHRAHTRSHSWPVCRWRDSLNLVQPLGQLAWCRAIGMRVVRLAGRFHRKPGEQALN